MSKVRARKLSKRIWKCSKIEVSWDQVLDKVKMCGIKWQRHIGFSHCQYLLEAAKPETVYWHNTCHWSINPFLSISGYRIWLHHTLKCKHSRHIFDFAPQKYLCVLNTNLTLNFCFWPCFWPEQMQILLRPSPSLYNTSSRMLPRTHF